MKQHFMRDPEVGVTYLYVANLSLATKRVSEKTSDNLITVLTS